MAEVVLDSSAILAVINGERGAVEVVPFLNNAVLSAVNYAEVISKLVERGMSTPDALRAVGGIGVSIVDFDSSQAERTGELRMETKRFGLSLGDRACLALAEREDAVAVTADKRWADGGLKIKVRYFR